MKVVTTCNKLGFDTYGYRILDSWKFWPRDAELTFFTEGFAVDRPGIVARPIDQIQDLTRFKQRYRNYEAVGYMYDVVRFAHKVFAAIEALYDYDGIGVWLDADCVTFKEIPQGFIESQIPHGHYMAMFKRNGLYTETGFWIVDCRHEQHKAFMDTWAEWYRSDAFKGLEAWTDCHTLDATVRKFEKAGLIKTHSLSGQYANAEHPMSFSELGQHIDHCKGQRKIDGKSPENKFREAA
jgi:hypothetical protein